MNAGVVPVVPSRSRYSSVTPHGLPSLSITPRQSSTPSTTGRSIRPPVATDRTSRPVTPLFPSPRPMAKRTSTCSPPYCMASTTRAAPPFRAMWPKPAVGSVRGLPYSKWSFRTLALISPVHRSRCRCSWLRAGRAQLAGMKRFVRRFRSGTRGSRRAASLREDSRPAPIQRNPDQPLFAR